MSQWPRSDRGMSCTKPQSSTFFTNPQVCRLCSLLFCLESVLLGFKPEVLNITSAAANVCLLTSQDIQHLDCGVDTQTDISFALLGADDPEDGPYSIVPYSYYTEQTKKAVQDAWDFLAVWEAKEESDLR